MSNDGAVIGGVRHSDGGHGRGHGDEGLGSQGMHTRGYTYHLREGKRAQRGSPEQTEEKGVVE